MTSIFSKEDKLIANKYMEFCPTILILWFRFFFFFFTQGLKQLKFSPYHDNVKQLGELKRWALVESL